MRPKNEKTSEFRKSIHFFTLNVYFGAYQALSLKYPLCSGKSACEVVDELIFCGGKSQPVMEHNQGAWNVVSRSRGISLVIWSVARFIDAMHDIRRENLLFEICLYEKKESSENQTETIG